MTSKLLENCNFIEYRKPALPKIEMRSNFSSYKGIIDER